jgi:uncharacterized protein
MNRLQYLDLLRGFAIFGILVSNLPMFAEPIFGVNTNHTLISPIIQSIIYFFITGKFFVIFSFVFGYGFTIFINSTEKKGLPIKPFFYRRLLGLLIIGIFHASLFFNGDILVSYAFLGFFLFQFKDFNESKIYKIAISFWFLSFLFYGVIGLLIIFGAKDDPKLAFDLTQKSLNGYLGNFQEAVTQRITEFFFTFPFIILFNWSSAFYMFMIGLWMGRLNLLSNPKQFFDRFNGYWLYIFLIGCFSNGLFVWGNIIKINYFTSFISNSSLAIGGISFALVYSYILFLISQSENMILSKIRFIISQAGKMSLTNYLLHSILLSWIFNGWGLGAFGKYPPEIYMILVFFIYGFNLIFSSIWLKFFDLGPFEIILRKITYK